MNAAHNLTDREMTTLRMIVVAPQGKVMVAFLPKADVERLRALAYIQIHNNFAHATPHGARAARRVIT